MTLKNDRIKEELKHLAGRFLMENVNKSSLVTVTNIEMSKDAKNATIFFTVFPDNFEKTALEFAKRKRSDFKKFVREESVIARIPHIDFQIDFGEKNRQKIDLISNIE